MWPLTTRQHLILAHKTVQIHNGLVLRPLPQIETLLARINRVSVNTEIRALVSKSFIKLYLLGPPGLDSHTADLGAGRITRRYNCPWEANIDDFPFAMEYKAPYRACLAVEKMQRLAVAQIIAQTIQRV